MKLEKLTIKNFRGTDSLEMDLRDELGRIETILPIVGPNTSGKTTILDAIALCLVPPTELGWLRADLQRSPSALVRRGSLRAQVTCTVSFSDEERAATQALYQQTESPLGKTLPPGNQVTVRWTFPDAQGPKDLGRHEFFPAGAEGLFKGRSTTLSHVHVPGVSPQLFQRLGGVFFFDQKRTGLGTFTTLEPRSEGPPRPAVYQYIDDAQESLLELAARAQAPQSPDATEREDFERLKDLFARVCQPHSIRGLYNTGAGLDMEFAGPKGTYLFNGLSSGQLMILLLLQEFARNRIHSSIVLIDELELHLHPLWQTRLYQSLQGLGQDNQIFFTTHSTHLRDLIRGAYFHTTGELGDQAVAKEEA